MALTNFAALTNEAKTAWSMDLWKHARNYSFMNQFTGTGPNSMIQRISELKKTEKGARAVITLLADLEGDGIAGDRALEGNEEAMQTADQVIRIDQLRHANRHEGRVADQKSIVNFRENSRDVLAYWLADRMDQMAFQTLGGFAYSLAPDGTTRVGSDLVNLEFAADVTAPTSQRFAQWDATTGLNVGTGTSAIAAGDVITWETLVRMREQSKNQYMRGLRTQGGMDELYHVFMTPTCMANLKMDNDYMLNLRHSTASNTNSKLFKGGAVEVDGFVLHEFRHVPHSASWGAGSVAGSAILMCGAQALAFADIGSPIWVEKYFDYDNQPGISVAKMMGFLKPRFTNIYAGGTVQDHGVFVTYVADNAT
jgi:N4-gp56 family major capsid protein